MAESVLPTTVAEPTMQAVPEHVLAGILLAMVVGPRCFFRATRLRASVRALDRYARPKPAPQPIASFAQAS